MWLELFGGLVYLLLAADLLVRGAVALARRVEMSPMVAGLTIVAMGTSAPELVVSLDAVFTGYPGIAIGNVVGSNIANVLMVLGLPALVAPAVADGVTEKRDVLFLLVVSVVFTVFCFAGSLGAKQGVPLMVLGLLFLFSLLRRSPSSEIAPEQEEPLERGLGLPTSRRMILLFLALGLVGLPLGAHLMVGGAVRIASWLGVSEAVIGVTLVAFGTSLPELATSVVAALHRHAAVAIGNVLGSNLFNVLAIMGIAATVAPSPIPVPESFLRFDLVVMMAATFAFAWFAWGSRTIERRAAALLVGSYLAYLYVLLGRFPGVSSAA